MKTKPISLRFDENDLVLAINKSGIKKTQKLMDFLLLEYVRDLKSEYLSLPKDYGLVKSVKIIQEAEEKTFTETHDAVMEKRTTTKGILAITDPKIKRPTNLLELKELCPYKENGFERSAWIATQRQKYGV